MMTAAPGVRYHMTSIQQEWLQKKRNSLRRRGRDLTANVVGRALFNQDGTGVGIITCCSSRNNLFVSWFGGKRSRLDKSRCKFDPNSRNWKIKRDEEILQESSSGR